jgi:hypothetical protein
MYDYLCITKMESLTRDPCASVEERRDGIELGVVGCRSGYRRWLRSSKEFWGETGSG